MIPVQLLRHVQRHSRPTCPESWLTGAGCVPETKAAQVVSTRIEQGVATFTPRFLSSAVAMTFVPEAVS